MTRDIDELKGLLEANKRALQILNQQIAALSPGPDPTEAREAGRFPYLYAVVDGDGEPGVRVVDPVATSIVSSLDERRDFRGQIVIQSDASFVVTHVLTALRADVGRISSFPFVAGGNEGLATFLGIQGGGPSLDGAARSAPDVELGFVEVGSGRVLFQAEESAGTTRVTDALLTGEFFNSTRLFAINQVNSVGHGPNTPFDLVSECLLPPNDVIEVIVRPTFYNNLSDANGVVPWRVYVALLGYKIFGD